MKLRFFLIAGGRCEWLIIFYEGSLYIEDDDQKGVSG